MAQHLPDKELARLVSNVTETMLGFSVEVSSAEPTSALTELASQLSLEGPSEYCFALSTDCAGGTSLGAGMFALEPAEVDDEMRNDSLSELVNMTAGQIKRALGVDDALGLPLPVSADELQAWRGVRLCAQGVDICVWQKPR